MKISNSRERLLELMNVYQLSQADIVKKTGVEKAAISNYVNGKREPRQDKISQIADAFNVDPAWLMGYDVPMKRGMQNYIISDKNASVVVEPYNPSINPLDMRLIQAYEDADELTKQMVKKILGIE